MGENSRVERHIMIEMPDFSKAKRKAFDDDDEEEEEEEEERFDETPRGEEIKGGAGAGAGRKLGLSLALEGLGRVAAGGARGGEAETDGEGLEIRLPIPKVTRSRSIINLGSRIVLGGSSTGPKILKGVQELQWLNITAYREAKKPLFSSLFGKKQKKELEVVNDLPALDHSTSTASLSSLHSPRPSDPAPEKGKRFIVQNANGVLKAGEMMAIMGPSGSGKTTMLNLLAGRTGSNMSVEGEVKMNGKKVPWKEIKYYSGFVTQEDVLEPFQTVKETVNFYAQLRLSASLSAEEKKKRVKETIRLLGLETCKDVIIGNSTVKGISGGEKKRTSIATDLLSNPSILFLDEPTSGLDSFTALHLMSHLKFLAKEMNMMVICSIHQPRQAIYSLFDSVFLLAQGQTVYFGPSSRAVKYFADVGFHIPPRENTADFFLDIITPDNTTVEAAQERKKQVASLITRYQEFLVERHLQQQQQKASLKRAPYLGQSEDEGGASIKEKKGRKDSGEKKSPRPPRLTYTPTLQFLPLITPAVPVKKEKARWPTQLYWLSVRSLRSQMRNSQYLLVRMISHIFMAVIIGLTWLDLDDSQEAVTDRNGFLFFTINWIGFLELHATIFAFPADRPLYLHDRAAGTYYPSTYLFAKLFSELPMHLVAPGLYVFTSYWIVGLNNEAKDFFVFLFTLIVFGLVFAIMGVFFSIALEDIESAEALSTVLGVLWAVFAGYFIKKDNIPDFFIWIHYIDPMKYALGSLFLSQYHKGDKIKCTEKEFAKGECIWKDSKQVYDYIGADDTEIYANFLIMFAFISFFTFGCYLALKYLNKHK